MTSSVGTDPCAGSQFYMLPCTGSLPFI